MSLADQLKHKVKDLKSKDIEYKNLEKLKVKLENEVEETMLELEVTKNKNVIDNNNLGQVQLNCPVCSEKYENKLDLNQHVRSNHYKDQVSQTPAFEPDINENEKTEHIIDEYSCFYCGEQVSSNLEKLRKHSLDCKELGLPHAMAPTSLVNYPPPFISPTDAPCYTCGARLPNKIELKNHYDSVHPDLILFWCDICYTNFGSERGLLSHRRNIHKVFD